jgi:glycine cleavage system H protein
MAAVNTPDNLKYAKTDEWVRVDGDEATIGISDYAQDALGDVVFLELPWEDAGKEIASASHFGDIESVKATSELFAPVSGTLLRVNGALRDQPDLVNSDPYGQGWMLVLKVALGTDLSDLMDAAAYAAYNENRDH